MILDRYPEEDSAMFPFPGEQLPMFVYPKVCIFATTFGISFQTNIESTFGAANKLSTKPLYSAPKAREQSQPTTCRY